MNRKLAAILLSLTLGAFLLVPFTGCDIRVTGEGFSDVLIGIDVDSDDLDFLDDLHDFHDDDDDDGFHIDFSDDDDDD